ncbi:MAG: hypothetical protein HYY16_12135 [Planctomycetes bacterium]|nr:hypothetical protein [Planctomycetota bacterium]
MRTLATVFWLALIAPQLSAQEQDKAPEVRVYIMDRNLDSIDLGDVEARLQYGTGEVFSLEPVAFEVARVEAPGAGVRMPFTKARLAEAPHGGTLMPVDSLFVELVVITPEMAARQVRADPGKRPAAERAFRDVLELDVEGLTAGHGMAGDDMPYFSARIPWPRLAADGAPSPSTAVVSFTLEDRTYTAKGFDVPLFADLNEAVSAADKRLGMIDQSLRTDDWTRVWGHARYMIAALESPRVDLADERARQIRRNVLMACVDMEEAAARRRSDDAQRALQRCRDGLQGLRRHLREEPAGRP